LAIASMKLSLYAMNSRGLLLGFWPRGEEQHWDGPAVNRYWLVIERETKAR